MFILFPLFLLLYRHIFFCAVGYKYIIIVIIIIGANALCLRKVSEHLSMKEVKRVKRHL